LGLSDETQLIFHKGGNAVKKKLNQDFYVGLTLIFIVAIFFTKALSIQGEAAMFPLGLLALLFILAILIILNSIKTKKVNDEKKEFEGEERKLNFELLKSPLCVLLITCFYILLMTYIGFFPATALFFVCYFLFMGIKGLLKYIFVISGFLIFIYVLFVLQLNVPTPKGLLFN
jgi:putative tricarboxylic transport membrane protein